MKCREFAEFIAGYFSDELPPETRQLFERHLSRCVNCSRYLDSYRQTMELGRRAFEDQDSPVPGEVPDELVKAILASRENSNG